VQSLGTTQKSKKNFPVYKKRKLLNIDILYRHLNRKKDQSVPAPSVNSEPLDNMFRVVTVVQQIIAELSGAASEEAKILAFTKNEK
jgi:hypothetical protein